MLTRKALFSLIAVATLGVAAALTATSADARPGGHGAKSHGGGGGVHRHVSIGRHHLRHLRPNLRRHIVIRPHWCFKHPWRCRRPIHVVRYPIYTGVAAASYARPASTCTCLTKTYLQDGSVLFKDVCTQETAINPAGQQAQVQ